MRATILGHISTHAGRLVAGALAVVAVLCWATPVPAATPARGSGGDPPAGKNCVAADEAKVAGDSGGEDEDAPPKFSRAFYKRVFSLDVSLDGMDGHELPVSIEEVCDVPRAYAREARQLAACCRAGPT